MKTTIVPIDGLYEPGVDTAKIICDALIKAEFNMRKPIMQREDIEKNQMIYSQEECDATETA